MENVLGKIRSGNLFPSTAIITPLLDSADTLKKMINAVDDSEHYDISRFIKELEAAETVENDGYASGASKIPDEQSGRLFTYTSQEYGVAMTVDPEAVYNALQTSKGRFVYIIEIDSLHDSIALQHPEGALFEEIGTVAKVITFKHVVGLPSPEGAKLIIVCASSLVKSVVMEILHLPGQRVQLVFSGKIVKNEHGQYIMPDNAGDYKLTDIPIGPVDKQDDGVLAGGNDAIAGTGKKGEKHRYEEIEKKSDSVLSQQELHNAEPAEKKVLYDKSLRVAIGTLDRLMTLAGEMVLTRNELLQDITTKNLHRIQAVSQKVDSITSELQETIMSTRMLSLGVVLNKFRRLVRDVAVQLGKQIVLDIKGEEVELDKSIVEAIGDPLTHLVRNAIDHGIETPDVRLHAGKKAFGTLLIKATQEAGHVLLEIVDDGKGIDPVHIKNKARTLGFIDEATFATISNAEAIKLIFKAGFSTAENVTELSGRGVGMDVVQNNLKRVGGSIDIDSIVGKGTTIRIKLPLTLAIIPALLICVEDERYAIPQSNIEELVRIPAAEVKRKIEAVGDATVLRLRGELLPLVRLTDVLGIQRTYIENASGIIRSDRRRAISDRRSAKNGPEKPVGEKRREIDRRRSCKSALNIVVVSAGDFRYGIIADSLLDSAEIVVKPLGYHLCDCREYAGATIMGDGHVALILDAMGIRRLLETRSDPGIIKREKEIKSTANVANNDSQPFLMIENGEHEYFAIPVGLISRIDKINESMISILSGKKIVHYRGATLRLFSIEEVVAVGKRQTNAKSTVYIVIIQACGREIGILASEIIDTISICASAVDCVTHIQPGIMGTAYIKDVFVLIVDVFGVVRLCAPELESPVTKDDRVRTMGSVLVVEDSVFFRHQLSSFIKDAGYEVVCRENGAQGLAYLKSEQKKIDIVLTDIEMPEMNGLELTRAIRSDERLKDIPVIALTSMSGESAERKGREAGVNEYLIKFERQSVLRVCKEYIKTGPAPVQRKEIV
jgi:two-component system chemotaxis sensor kinase CheA